MWQTMRTVVQMSGSKRVFSMPHDVALFNVGNESPEEKMAKKWKQNLKVEANAGSPLNLSLPAVPLQDRPKTPGEPAP